MKLTLKIEGKEKNFTTPFISGRMLRKTLEFQKTNDLTDINAELLDKMVDYVVDLFGKQFTQDEFYDGLEAGKMISTITSCLNEVIYGASKATEGLQDPNE